ncbi:MAG: tetratricopeptide repeat protein [Akkermansiaceae bacterium]
MIRNITSILFTGALTLYANTLYAQPLPLTGKYFQSEAFKKSFVGSYGFLPAVEPKVDSEESAFLADLAPLLDQGRFRQAESDLRNMMRARQLPGADGSKPKGISPAMVFVLGNLYYQSGRENDAEKSYKQALEKFPKFRRAHKNLAMLYASSQKYDLALPHLQQAIQLGESDDRTYGLLGFTYLQKENAVAAESAYRQALLLAPDEKDWKMGLAQAFLLQEKWKEAASYLGTLIQENPENDALILQQANAYLGMDEKLRAAENFEILSLMGRADVQTLNLLGNIYIDQNEPILALGAYTNALKDDKTVNLKGSIDAARILIDYGALDEGEKLIANIRFKYGKEMPKELYTKLLLTETKVSKEKQDHQLTEKLLQETLEITPGQGDAMIELGLLYEALANEEDDETKQEALYAKAATRFRMVLEDGKVAYQANLRYAQMQVRRSQFVLALPYLEKAYELKPGDNLAQYVRRVRRAAEREKTSEK